jgi:hypothetical protein
MIISARAAHMRSCPGRRIFAIGTFPEVTIAAGRTGNPDGRAAVPDSIASATLTVLSGGQSAHRWLRVADAANIPARQCKPVGAAGPHQTGPDAMGHRLPHTAAAAGHR